VSDATLTGLVKELRRALDNCDSAARFVRTVHGVGYAFAIRLDRELPPLPTESRWLVTGGRRIALTQRENVIGRDPAAAVCLDVAGVSRPHARIVIGEGGAVLDDLGSKNGTTVADHPVTEGVALHDGDQIYIGSVLIIFHASTSGLPTETVAGSASR
jgi:pSer/pThr/pTyr-binding forkhead associated (FHA) protein